MSECSLRICRRDVYFRNDNLPDCGQFWCHMGPPESLVSGDEAYRGRRRSDLNSDSVKKMFWLEKLSASRGTKHVVLLKVLPI